MSRAFVKEQDAGSVVDFGERPVSDRPNDVTATGLAKIEFELANAQKEHAEAQRDGDRHAIARTARDLRYWESRRASANLVPPNPDTSAVRFGHTVTLARDDGRRQTFRIVGEDEADPANGTLSHASPLARALFGKSVSDTVRVGAHDLDILDIA
jgi:transcription elongation GreA/GreB family factor